MAEIIYEKNNEFKGFKETVMVVKYHRGCYLASRLKTKSDFKEYDFEFFDRQKDAIEWCNGIISVWELQRKLKNIEMVQ